MNNQSGIKTNRNELTVLSVSPYEQDHASLQDIMGHSTWKLLQADKISTAKNLLHDHAVSVVVCEFQLMPGTWVDMLKHIEPMPNPPSVIVTSRLADERLWAEALNLGAWDVLPKPFDRSEVIRSVKVAWEHWYHQVPSAAAPMSVMRAAS
ncbi:MAG TPA: response regulator [Terracidiphilus sp.]